jgi:hypothetical protein
MTYQEILQAIESLPRHERDRLIESIGRQQIEHSGTVRQPLDRSTAGSSSKYTLPELTPEELAQRAERIKKSQERDEQIRQAMTPAEVEQSRIAFEILDESLRAARGLGDNWE